jgi:glycogen phosphorylase
MYLPENIARLKDIAYDLWWASSAEARAVFKMISPRMWRESEHNPVRLLQNVEQSRLNFLAGDPQFKAAYETIVAQYEHDLGRPDTLIATTYPELANKTIAYFSAEYGLHTSLPIYSGGLGILAGDHIKTASDIGLDLVAVGFLYPHGYFEQRIDRKGKQHAEYHQLELAQTPLQLARRPDGSPCIVTVKPDNTGQPVALQIWFIKVGRITIYLMDSDLEINQPEDRELTRRLYGGDKIYRLRQEMALGIGGARALEAMGIVPDVWHANEGHAAFLFIERLRNEVERGKPFQEALEHIRATSLFTTHTPVPAGHDAFGLDTIAEYFSETIAKLGISREEFLQLGIHSDPSGDAFNMTALALNMTRYRNAVSEKHEEVSKAMWPMFGDIGHVTNGVHIPTWLAQEWRILFSSLLGTDWKRRLTDRAFWKNIYSIPDEVIWSLRLELNKNLQRFILQELRKNHLNESDTDLVVRGALFDPTALTIGFARRFATYKRSTLLFHDPNRLGQILNNSERPVQIVFSGKAHPADEEGQALIRDIWQKAEDPRFRGKLFFLENYDMHSAKFLVSGADLWLNMPRVPLEASGTSGMKAAINGVPNCSVLDGWWCEGYNGSNGWAISSVENTSPDEQDAHDAEALYRLLESEIVPLYYERDLSDIPRGWVQVVKESMISIIPQFTSERMLSEYIEKFYTQATRS